MSEHENETPGLGETVVAASGLPEEEKAGSLLDALASDLNSLATERETLIPVPGFGAKSGVGLSIRYRLLEGPELVSIGQRIQREFRKTQQYDRVTFASIDTMIAATTGFVAIKDGEEIELPFTNFGLELAQALRIADKIDDNNPARSVVVSLFGGNMVALQQHSLLLARWMGDTSIDVTAEFLEAGGNL